MFLIPLLLSASLDLTLPEFQPEVDASGNYIVGYYDEVEEESVVELVPAADLEIDSTEYGGLSPSEEVDAFPMLRAIETHSVDSSVINNRPILYQNGHMVINSKNGSYPLYYIYLTAGIEYTVIGSPNYTAPSISVGTVCTSFNSSTITPSENIYLISNVSSFSVSYTTGEPDPEPEDPSGNDPEPEDPSGNDPQPDNPSGGDFDDTNIVSKLNDLLLNQRALTFICLIQFLYPLALSFIDNIIGGDKNV